MFDENEIKPLYPEEDIENTPQEVKPPPRQPSSVTQPKQDVAKESTLVTAKQIAKLLNIIESGHNPDDQDEVVIIKRLVELELERILSSDKQQVRSLSGEVQQHIKVIEHLEKAVTRLATSLSRQ